MVPRAQTSAGGSMGGLSTPSTNRAKATSGAQATTAHSKLKGSVPASRAAEDMIRKRCASAKRKLTISEIKQYCPRESFGTSDVLIVGSERITRSEDISR